MGKQAEVLAEITVNGTTPAARSAFEKENETFELPVPT